MLAQTHIPEIMDGVKIVRRFSAYDKMRILAMQRETMRDEISALCNARAEGIAAGEAKGRKSLLDALVQKYRSKGMSESEIAGLLSID